MRKAEIARKTKETDIAVRIDLDGKGRSNISTGVGFLDHMLDLLAVHSRFDIDIECNGDVRIDDHHSTEDIGIALGRAFSDALGDRKGITRYGSAILPMDEALIMSAVDISGRGWLEFDLGRMSEKVGTFDTELVKEFFIAFSRNAGITLHIRRLAGENTHHIIEGAFKSVARSLRTAVSIDADFRDEIPSSKGVL